MEEQKRLVTKYDCCLPLSFLALLLKGIHSLSEFEQLIQKKPIGMFFEGYTSEYSKPECRGLYNLEFTIEQIIETNYFIRIKYSLINAHPSVTKCHFIINLHYMSLNKTSILCELELDQKPNVQLESTECIDNKMHIHIPDIIQKNNFKSHQSTVLIGCSFSIIKKVLLNFKLFNQIVPELCTRVVTRSSMDLIEGDEIKLIYDIPNKPSIIVCLKATSVINKEEELSITLETEELGLSNTPSQQIEWIARRISSYEIKVILRHSFESVIQEEIIEFLSKEKKIVLNKLKNVLEMMDNIKMN